MRNLMVRKVVGAFAGSALLMAGALSPVYSAAAASGVPQGQDSTPCPDDSCTPFATATPTPAATSSGGAVTTIQNFTTNLIRFGADAFIEAYDGVQTYMLEKSLERLDEALTPLVTASFLWLFEINSDGLQGLNGGAFYGPTLTLHGQMLKVALLFVPLLILANIAEIYLSGVSADVARAQLWESLLFALGRVALAAASFWVVHQALRLGWATTAVIMETGAGFTASEIALILVAGLLGPLTLLVPAIGGVMFYIYLLVLILAITLVTAIIVAYYAFVVIVVTLIVIAPLIAIVGGIPNFRWLYGLWLKLGTAVIMLPIANAVLLRLFHTMRPLGHVNNVGGAITQIALVLGFLSLLVIINGTVGKFIYAPVMEAGRKAKEGVIGLATTALGVAGLVTGAGAATGLFGGMLADRPGPRQTGAGGAPGGTPDGGNDSDGGTAAGGNGHSPAGAGSGGGAAFDQARLAAHRGELTRTDLRRAKQEYDARMDVAHAAAANPFARSALAAQRSGDIAKFAELERIIGQREAPDQTPVPNDQKAAEKTLGLDRAKVGRLAFGDGYDALDPRALAVASGTFIAPTAELLATRMGGQFQGGAMRDVDPNQVAAATLVLGADLNPKPLGSAGLQLGQPGAMSVQDARAFLHGLSSDPNLGMYSQTVLDVYNTMRNAPPGSQVGYQPFHSTVSQRIADRANAATATLAQSGSSDT